MNKDNQRYTIDMNISTIEYEELKKLALNNSQTIDEYVNNLIKKNVNYLYFEDDIKYNIRDCKLYNENQEIIKLTKNENKLFELLIENRDRISSIDEIISLLWKDEPKSGLYIIRNAIKHIRDKSSQSIIKNYSKKGYKINPKDI